MLPFLLPLVASAFTWAHGTRRGALLVGVLSASIVSAVAIYTLTAATFPYWPDSMKNPLVEVTFRLLEDAAVAPNVLRHALGAVSLLPYLALIVALVGLTLVRAATWRGAVIAAALGVLIVGAFELVPRTPGDRATRGYTNTVLPAVKQ
jgi:hypothetical protein